MVSAGSLNCQSTKTVVAVILLINKVCSQILSSSDLNCSFNTECQWRNASNGEQDDGDFFIANNVFADAQHISSKTNNFGDKFAYTNSAFEGTEQRAMLISDVVSCQLGGANLKLWYYRTDAKTTLDVCIRQPPGNLLPNGYSCFPIFAGNHLRQWLYGAVEFPPVSQPFELVIKATFLRPHHVIAIDDIVYDAILCENGYLQPATNTFKKDSDKKKVSIITAENLEWTDKKMPSLEKNVDLKLPETWNPFSRNTFNESDTESFISFAEKVVPLLIPALFEILKPPPVQQKPQAVKSNSLYSQLSENPIVPVNNLFFSFDQMPQNIAKNKLLKKDPNEQQTDLKLFGTKQKEVVSGVSKPLLESSSSSVETSTKHNSSRPNLYPNLRRQIKLLRADGNNTLRSRSKHKILTPIVSTTVPSVTLPTSTAGSEPRVIVNIISEAPENQNFLMTSERRNPFEDMKKFKRIRERVLSAKTLKTSEKRENLMLEPSFIVIKDLKKPENRVTVTTEAPPMFNKKSFPQFAESNSLKNVKENNIRKKLPKKVIEQLSILKQIPNLEKLIEGLDLSLLDTPKGFALLKQQFLERFIRSKAQMLNKNPDKNVNAGLNEGAGGAYDTTTTTKHGAVKSDFFENLDGPLFIPPVVDANSRYFPLIRNETRIFSGNRLVPSGVNECPVVECSFDDATLCSYAKNPLDEDADLVLGLPIGTVVKGWSVSKGKVENSLTGIVNDSSKKGFFAYAGETSDSQAVFLLSNAHAFTVAEAATLNFQYHLAGKHGRLRVCIDTLQICPAVFAGQNITLLSDTWRNGNITIPKGTHVVHFVADLLRKNYAIGVDNIRLLRPNTLLKAKCFIQ